MKVLFICCRSNVGRSQMAVAPYNKLTDSNDAQSVGMQVDTPGQTLQARTMQYPGVSYAIEAMWDKDLDIRNNRAVQLTKGILKDYDVIVNMAAKRNTPNWLSDAPNYVHMQIRDPMGKNYLLTANTEQV